MLNVFPQLLVFNFFAPALLRIVAAGTFFYLAFFHFSNRKAVTQELSLFPHAAANTMAGIFALVECAVAVLLLLGLWTQIAALIGFIICLKIVFIRKGLHHISPLSHLSYLLLATICLSLLCTGAGAIAFDIPL